MVVVLVVVGAGVVVVVVLLVVVVVVVVVKELHVAEDVISPAPPETVKTSTPSEY